MTSTSSPLPEWLQRADRQGYLNDVYKVLTERERKRSDARRDSVHASHLSATHRVAHKAATILKDSSLSDHYSVSFAHTPNNLRGNRYVDVAPYDRTRVVVGHYGSEPSGRYLNASWVRELAGGKWWIASQAPLPHTAHAFLSLILQPVIRPLDPSPGQAVTGSTSRIRTIVQLTPFHEGGIKKADQYFPDAPGESWVQQPEPGCSAPTLRVTLVERTRSEEAQCTESTLSIQPLLQGGDVDTSADPVVFKHLFYDNWPDHHIPEDTDGLLRFIQHVDTVNRDVSFQSPSVRSMLDPDPPIIVGCSAGIGRTGTFIAMCSILRAHRFLPPSTSSIHDGDSELPTIEPSPLGDLPEEFKDDEIVKEVDALREQRPMMVQRPDQLKLVYETLMQSLAHAVPSDLH